MRFLGEELSASVFRAEPDAADVDLIGLIQDRDGRFVNALEDAVVGGGLGFGGDSWDDLLELVRTSRG